MAKATGKVPQIDRALLADHIPNIGQCAIPGDRRTGGLIPLRITNVFQRHNAVIRVVDRRVKDGFTGRHPVALSPEPGFVAGIVPDDLGFLLLEPFHIASGFAA
jgi:hypothetical protein